MHDFRHGQVAELFTDADQLIDHALKLPHRLDLPAVDGQKVRIGEPLGKCLLSDLACQERIRSAFDRRAVAPFDRENLLGQGTASQLWQAGELLEQSLPSVLQAGVIGGRYFNIVVIILQYKPKKRSKNPKPTFISSTPFFPFCFDFRFAMASWIFRLFPVPDRQRGAWGVGLADADASTRPTARRAA